MTNPNNSVGTNGAFGGRTSVNAFNDGIAAYSAGILSGWVCEPDSGLTVVLGGDGNTRDVAIAEDNAGNKTTINNISGSPISVTVGAAPNSNSRIDSIVAYVDNPPTGSSTATDNYGACGLIVVAGTVASTPVAPNESTIRSAITADGGSGTTAYYVVLANITIASGVTDLTSSEISAGSKAELNAKNVAGTDYSLTEVNTGTKWVDGKEIYRRTIYVSSFPNTTQSSLGNLLPANISIISIEGMANAGTGVLPVNGIRYGSSGELDGGVACRADQSTGEVIISSNRNYTSYSGYVTFYYTK